MSNEIDHSNLPELPRKLGEKLKAIRDRSHLTPDEFAPHVKAQDGAAIESYESSEGDMPVSVLWAYVKLSGLPLENFITRCPNQRSRSSSIAAFIISLPAGTSYYGVQIVQHFIVLAGTSERPRDAWDSLRLVQ